ncbi:MAG: hypothetical protein IIB99_08580 [Planctomycetes bacterium]|nr:hypothetical protein [Planctomycetota bacterium]MCH8211415.1 hypothetical protein [Planctomycetota bacterium]
MSGGGVLDVETVVIVIGVARARPLVVTEDDVAGQRAVVLYYAQTTPCGSLFYCPPQAVATQAVVANNRPKGTDGGVKRREP